MWQRLASSHIQNCFRQIEVSHIDVDQECAREPAPGNADDLFIGLERGFDLLLERTAVLALDLVVSNSSSSAGTRLIV
jgi:hypothetical protein